MSAVQVLRGPRHALLAPDAHAAPARRARRTFGSRHLGLALVIGSPFLFLTAWLWIDAPAELRPLAPRVTALALATIGVAGLVLRRARRRALDDVRLLNRVVRRIELGDFEGDLPCFADPDVERLATECATIARRLYDTKDELDQIRDRARREYRRQESVLESIASENARLKAEAQVLHGFGGILNKTVGPPQICAELIENIPGEVEYARATVYLLDSGGQQLVLQALRDPEHPRPLAGNFLKDRPVGRELSTRTAAGWVTQTGNTVLVKDTHVDPRCVELRADARSVLAVALRGRRSVLGVVQLDHPRPAVYDRSDERILSSLANQAAIAIENVRLFEEAAKVEALRELDRLKSELLSTVSHELRTPLASIKGYAGTLLRTDVEWDVDTRREFLQIIDEESDRLGELIEDLLQMSQIEAGILRIDPRALKIPRVAQRVVKKARARATNHEFEIDFPADFPDIMADPRRIEQVLRNLVENAIKYSPEGGTIKVRGDVREGAVHVAVHDQGIGISPEDLGRVFDRFFRADGDAVRHAGGTGLGLSICQGIVQMHGGRIWAESAPSEGSTFQFTLPLTPPARTQEESA